MRLQLRSWLLRRRQGHFHSSCRSRIAQCWGGCVRCIWKQLVNWNMHVSGTGPQRVRLRIILNQQAGHAALLLTSYSSHDDVDRQSMAFVGLRYGTHIRPVITDVSTTHIVAMNTYLYCSKVYIHSSVQVQPAIGKVHQICSMYSDRQCFQI